MHAALEVLLADGVIDEVVARLKSGKEADVYIVTHGGQLVAAKIYKERTQRSFKNNSGYKEGRLVRNSRTRRAMEKGSRFGQEAEEDAWKTAETEALSQLHNAGVRVPTPVLFYEGVLLMELVVDTEGQPAPRLVDALLSPELAAEFYRDLLRQVVKMLCCDLIHGDLSAYNILLGAQGPTIIDFPQTVGAAANSQAEFFFTRDVENLRLFFAGYDRSLLNRTGDTAEIWRAYVRRELTPDFEPSGRAAPDGRGARAGGRSGARPHAEGGRPFAPRERQQPGMHEPAAAAAVPEVEDEFALLRQGGGERPKVAQLARADRGADRSRRGGSGGGPRGGARQGPPRPATSNGGHAQPHGARAPQGGGAPAQPHPARAPHGGGGQPHGARAPHGGGGGQAQPHGARAPHGGAGQAQPHSARAPHGGGQTQPQGARPPHGGGGKGGPHGRRQAHGNGGQGAARGANAPAAAGGGHAHAAPGGARPQHGNPGPRGDRNQAPRPPRSGSRSAAPVVSYVSRGNGPAGGGSTEEP